MSGPSDASDAGPALTATDGGASSAAGVCSTSSTVMEPSTMSYPDIRYSGELALSPCGSAKYKPRSPKTIALGAESAKPTGVAHQ